MLRVVVLVLAALASSLAQNGSPPESPCPGVFSYSQSPGQGWHGVVTIVPPLVFSEVQLLVKLAVSKYRPDADVGHIEVLGGSDEVQQIANRASKKQWQKIQYKVVFPPYTEFPRVSSVTINGNDFCSVPTYENARGVIELKYTLKTGLDVPFSNGNEFSVAGESNQKPQPPVQQPWQQTQQPQWQQQQTQWQQQQTQRPQKPPQVPQRPQQPQRPDTIVWDINGPQIATGRPHDNHHGDTDSFGPSRPNTTPRPRRPLRPTTDSIVFPGQDPELPMKELEELLPGLDPSNPIAVRNGQQVLINLIQTGTTNNTHIENLLKTLVRLVRPISMSITDKEKQKRKGNKKEAVAQICDDDDVDDDDDDDKAGDDASDNDERR